MRLHRGVVILALFTLVFGVCAFAADKDSKDGSKENVAAKPAAIERDSQFDPDRRKKDPDEIQVEKKMAKDRAKERYQQLVRDSDKLLQLATELKQYVDKTKESILSVEVIRKAEEIEKLSKSVKEKMRGE